MANAMLAAEHFQCSNAVLRPGEAQIDSEAPYNTPHLCCFDLPDATLAFDARKSHICAVFLRSYPGSDMKFTVPIRNTLILGLVFQPTC